MLITGLIYLAASQADAAAVAARYLTFLHAHPVLSVECVITGRGETATGELIVKRSSTLGAQVDWLDKLPEGTYRFTANGPMGIEVDSAYLIYDRQATYGVPLPKGRVGTVFGFPFAVVSGKLPFAGGKDTSLTHKGNIDELVRVVRTNQGEVTYTGDFAADGEMIKFRHRARASERQAARAHRVQRLPLWGRCQEVDVQRGAADRLRTVRVRSGSKRIAGHGPASGVEVEREPSTTLSDLANKPNVLLVFVDDPLPSGMIASLERLSHHLPVALIALGTSTLSIPSQLPLYRTDDAGFDTAGIRATCSVLSGLGRQGGASLERIPGKRRHQV